MRLLPYTEMDEYDRKVLHASLKFLEPDYLVIGSKQVAKDNIWNFRLYDIEDPFNWSFDVDSIGKDKDFYYRFNFQPFIHIVGTNFGGSRHNGHDLFVRGQNVRPHMYIDHSWATHKLPAKVTTEDMVKVLFKAFSRIDSAKLLNADGSVFCRPYIRSDNTKRTKKKNTPDGVLREFRYVDDTVTDLTFKVWESNSRPTKVQASWPIGEVTVISPVIESEIRPV